MRHPTRQSVRRACLEALEARHLLTGFLPGPPEPIVTPDISRPASMLTADFDLDGDIDLLVEAAEGVVYFRNLDGRGDFQREQVPGVSGADFAADLDSDGDVDLIHVGNRSTITTYLNNGQGQFIAASQVDPGLDFDETRLSDVDGDGDIDLAGFGWSSRDPLFVWLENDGAGNLRQAASRIERDPSERFFFDTPVLADLDSDGDVDLLRSPRLHSRVTFFENTGHEFLAERELFRVPGQFDAILPPIDLDKDGDVDLMFGDAWGPAFVYWNDLANNVPSPSDFVQVMDDDFPYGPDGSRWLIDVDSDGDDDLVAQSYRGDLQWFENNAARFGKSRPIAKFTDYSELSFVDLDGDGDLDVAAATDTGDSVAWYENDGLTFEQHVLIEGELDAISKVLPVDIDSDGDLDFVALDRWGIVWFQNMGDATFERERIVAGDVNDLDIGKLEQDGIERLDIVYTTDSQTVWMHNRGWSQAPQSTVLGPGAVLVQIADINGDGEIDVVTAGANGSLTAYVNSMIGPTFEPIEFYRTGPSESLQSYLSGEEVDIVDENDPASIVVAFWLRHWPVESNPPHDDVVTDFDIGDIDGDGDMDLVVTSVFILGPGDLVLYYVELLTSERRYFDSPSTLLSGFEDDGLLGIQSVEIGDVNADGSNDLLWSGEPREEYHTLAWVEFGVDAVSETHVIIEDDDGAYHVGDVELIDVNQDGRPEVYSRGLSSTLYELRDDGTFAGASFFREFPAWGIRYLGDFDGDGDVDVVVTNDSRIDLVRNVQEADLDGNGQIDARDVDLAWTAIQSGDQNSRLDFNGDGQVDQRDGTHLLVSSLRRGIADVNLDGVFNSLDLVSVLQAGKYGSDEVATWSEGDWNMDGRFDMLDLVLALRSGDFVA